MDNPGIFISEFAKHGPVWLLVCFFLLVFIAISWKMYDLFLSPTIIPGSNPPKAQGRLTALFDKQTVMVDTLNRTGRISAKHIAAMRTAVEAGQLRDGEILKRLLAIETQLEHLLKVDPDNDHQAPIHECLRLLRTLNTSLGN